MSDTVIESTPQFTGFPDRMELVPIPAAVIGTLLREITDLAELKTLLYVLQLLHGQRHAPRFVRRGHLEADAALLGILEGGAAIEHHTPVVRDALDLAERHGALVALAIADGGAEDVCYLLNTPGNRRIVEQVRAGERTLGELGPVPSPQEPTRPEARVNIYDLYEQNIGLLTPLLAEELSEAIALYPAGWIEDAFREAVAQNKRNWRYVRRILEGWESRGRGSSGTTWRRPETPKGPGGYLETRYGRLTPR